MDRFPSILPSSAASEKPHLMTTRGQRLNAETVKIEINIKYQAMVPHHHNQCLELSVTVVTAATTT